MGITGLLPMLSNSIKKKPISKYKNKKIGIDGHCWLYQISNLIAEELYYGIETTRHLNILNYKLKALQKHNITPCFVFDGDSLESKEVTNNKRKEQKEKIKREIELLLKANNLSRAKELMKRCVSINEYFLCSVLEFLKKNDIEFIISPYESDAQLTYLQRINYIDYILTEDSDLILFGCTNILYKFDLVHVHEFDNKTFMKNNDQNFVKNLLEICILNGCDYLEGLPGVGLKTAIKLFEKHKTLEEVIENRKLKGNVPADYLESVQRAKLTFAHQVVYCPLQEKRIHLTEMSDNYPYSFLGRVISNATEFSRGHFLLNRMSKNFLSIPKEEYKNPVKTEDKVIYSFEKKKIKSIKEKEIVIDENEESPFFKKK